MRRRLLNGAKTALRKYDGPLLLKTITIAYGKLDLLPFDSTAAGKLQFEQAQEASFSILTTSAIGNSNLYTDWADLSRLTDA